MDCAVQLTQCLQHKMDDTNPGTMIAVDSSVILSILSASISRSSTSCHFDRFITPVPPAPSNASNATPPPER
jgi:hypothetical protein